MIHDATGKFSSRCPLPDRNSLALVIKNRLLLSKLEISHNAACCAHATGVADPYRRIRRQNQCYLVSAAGPGTHPKPRAMADDRMRTRAAIVRGFSKPYRRQRKSWDDFPAGTAGWGE